tara:strand:+ start:2643 stop:3908 length:1266 start_codon:yes stop_codon:yes gene_type:complete
MFFLYRILTTTFFPIFVLIIYIRKLLGKEDVSRYKEKISIKLNQLPDDQTIWFHGASIGEVMSIIPLIEYLIKKDNSLKILITSVTLSSGKIIEKKFLNNKNIYHQYLPLDVNHLIKKFLENWKPKFVGFVDSEIWPNFIYEIKKRKIPLVLVNGRITNKTLKRWLLLKKFAEKIFSSFDICLACSKESFNNLKQLKANNIKYFGNLKYFSNEKKEIILSNSIIQDLDKRSVWCAVSTHPGEEQFLIGVHNEIKKNYPNILTIIIPRHINRVKSIFLEFQKKELKIQILHKEEKIKKDTDILLISSIGELSKYYNYSKSVFIGKSLLKRLQLVAGQNPIEAAKQGCKIYHGPYVYNFLEVYKYLNNNCISEEIKTEMELSTKIINDLKTPKKLDLKKIEKINLYGNEIFQNFSKELNKLLF